MKTSDEFIDGITKSRKKNLYNSGFEQNIKINTYVAIVSDKNVLETKPIQFIYKISSHY